MFTPTIKFHKDAVVVIFPEKDVYVIENKIILQDKKKTPKIKTKLNSVEGFNRKLNTAKERINKMEVLCSVYGIRICEQCFFTSLC